MTDIDQGWTPEPGRSHSLHADAYTEQRWFDADQQSIISASGQLWVLDGGLSAQVQQMRL